MNARQIRAAAFDAVDSVDGLQVDFTLPLAGVTHAIMRAGVACFERAGWTVDWHFSARRQVACVYIDGRVER